MRVKLDKMLQQYKMELSVKPPRSRTARPSRGSPKAIAGIKKQTGGAGSSAKCSCASSRCARQGYEFVDKVKGGVIPNTFIPAVERACAWLWTRASSPATRSTTSASLYTTANTTPWTPRKSRSYRRAAKPSSTRSPRREPSSSSHRQHRNRRPDKFMGDLTNDLSGKRGHVTGTTPRAASSPPSKAWRRYRTVRLPMRLKSVTGGQGSYSIDFSHYAPVPPHTQAQLVSKHKQPVEEEE